MVATLMVTRVDQLAKCGKPVATQTGQIGLPALLIDARRWPRAHLITPHFSTSRSIESIWRQFYDECTKIGAQLTFTALKYLLI